MRTSIYVVCFARMPHERGGENPVWHGVALGGRVCGRCKLVLSDVHSRCAGYGDWHPSSRCLYYTWIVYEWAFTQNTRRHDHVHDRLLYINIAELGIITSTTIPKIFPSLPFHSHIYVPSFPNSSQQSSSKPPRPPRQQH